MPSLTLRLPRCLGRHLRCHGVERSATDRAGPNEQRDADQEAGPERHRKPKNPSTPRLLRERTRRGHPPLGIGGRQLGRTPRPSRRLADAARHRRGGGSNVGSRRRPRRRQRRGEGFGRAGPGRRRSSSRSFRWRSLPDRQPRAALHAEPASRRVLGVAVWAGHRRCRLLRRGAIVRRQDTSHHLSVDDRHSAESLDAVATAPDRLVASPER